MDTILSESSHNGRGTRAADQSVHLSCRPAGNMLLSEGPSCGMAKRQSEQKVSFDSEWQLARAVQ